MPRGYRASSGRIERYQRILSRIRSCSARSSASFRSISRHPGIAQAAQDAEPGQIVIGENPLATGVPRNVVEQTDPLVVAQRVEAEAGLLGDLAGGVVPHPRTFPYASHPVDPTTGGGASGGR